MANKTIGKDYLVFPDDGEVPHRGIYYFAKYHECKNCGRKTHIYLDNCEACDFVMNASPSFDKRSFFAKIKDRIPHIKLVVEKGSEHKERWA